jgi:Kef-type K+ transport system membrane component KefB
VSFAGLVVVCAVAFTAPFLLGLVPRLRLPAIVLEILAGIAIGPAGFGWVTIDPPIRVLSIIGLAFLLFLAGLELDLQLLRGRRLKAALSAFALSIVLAYGVGLLLHAAGLVESALLVAVILSATALGIVVPVLKDAGEGMSEFGQLVVAGASIADFGTVLALSLLFSREVDDPAAQLLLVGGFVILTVVIIVALMTAERSARVGGVLIRLQDSTAQIRIRGAFLLLIAFSALAARFGLEVILGAFVAGALLSVLDRDYAETHPKFHEKLEAIGFGVFIPVFFVTSGLQFDLQALFGDVQTVARVPIFFLALALVRGVPALLYRPLVGANRALVAGLLQATSLPFIVAGAAIGVEAGALTRTNASALIAAGLLSVVIFPMTALALLRRNPSVHASPSPSSDPSVAEV